MPTGRPSSASRGPPSTGSTHSSPSAGAARRPPAASAAAPDDNAASRRLFESLGFEEVPRSALRQWYGWRGIGVQMRMVLAPHEVLLARTFADPSPAPAQ